MLSLVFKTQIRATICCWTLDRSFCGRSTTVMPVWSRCLLLSAVHEGDRGHSYAPFTGDLLFIKDLYMVMVERFRITLTANVNLYHLTMAGYQGSLCCTCLLPFSTFTKKNYYFHIIFIHKNCFGLLFCFVLCFFFLFTLISVWRNSQLESAVWRLP